MVKGWIPRKTVTHRRVSFSDHSQIRTRESVTNQTLRTRLNYFSSNVRAEMNIDLATITPQLPLATADR